MNNAYAVQRRLLVGAALALVCCGVNAEPRNFQAVYTNLDARSKDTDFCGYSVPHPSEPLMNVRLQTTGRPANAVMDDGLAQLSSICDSLTAQLDAQEALATTRARSGSVSNNAFPGPGKKT